MNAKRINRRLAKRLALVGLGVAVAYWIIDSIGYAMLYSDGGILRALFPEIREACVRATVFSLIAAFGVVAQIVVNQRLGVVAARVADEQRREQERALAVASDRLRALGEMASSIAHELNQPLTGVRGMAEHVLLGLDRDWQFDKESLRSKAARIIEQTDRMNRIIERVRTFAREAGKPELRSVKINDVVSASMKMVGSQFRRLNIQLEFEATDELPSILVNPFSLEEVVLSLLANARDAVEDERRVGGDSASVVTLRTGFEDRGEDGVWVKLEVSDRGPGISDEILERVFEPFFTTKGPDRGAGLGLPNSRAIIQKFSGTIGIETAPGDGTTVTLSLPAEPIDGDSDRGAQ